MIICMMNDNFYRSSGAAIAIRRIAESLSEVEFYVAGCGDGRLQEDLSWVPAQRYEFFNLKTSNLLLTIRELNRFKRWFKQQGCDLVHCHHRRVAALLHMVGVPVLYTGQLIFPKELWFRLLRPKWMTAITPSVALNLLETTGRKVIACIGNPTHFPNTAPPIDLEIVRHKAVCVARLDPVKGHKHLLAAWKILYDRGHRYELDLVGEGVLRDELRGQAQRDGIYDLIHFRGFNSDVSAIIRESLFAILVSEIEGQGIVTLEAAAMGRASLLTAVPGSVDLLPPERSLTNGVRFGDPHALADVLEQWFSCPDRVQDEGKIFFDHLKTTCDPIAIGKQYHDIYSSLVRRTAQAA
jgi:glycosyltransferase involved in cell wall biosynthesis